LAELRRNTFGSIAEEYLHIARGGREAVTVKKSRWLYSLMEADLGAQPSANIKPADLLIALRKIEAKGHYETARRMRSLASRIFRFAAATSRVDSDPTNLLRGALIAPKVRHHGAQLEPQQVAALLRSIDGYDGQPLTQIALKLAPQLFVRPGELRRAEWHQIDFQKKIWTIPAEKMKMRDPHVVPLSRQVIELLEGAQALSSGQKFAFSSLYPGDRPISGALTLIGTSQAGRCIAAGTSHSAAFCTDSSSISKGSIGRSLQLNRATASRGDRVIVLGFGLSL
jgi:integrase